MKNVRLGHATVISHIKIQSSEDALSMALIDKSQNVYKIFNVSENQTKRTLMFFIYICDNLKKCDQHPDY